MHLKGRGRLLGGGRLLGRIRYWLCIGFLQSTEKKEGEKKIKKKKSTELTNLDYNSLYDGDGEACPGAAVLAQTRVEGSFGCETEHETERL